MRLGSIRLKPAGEGFAARIQRVKIAALATVDSVDLSAVVGRTQIAVSNTIATYIQLADGAVRTDSVTLPSLILPRAAPQRIAIPLVNVGHSSGTLERRADGSWNLPPAADLTSFASQLQAVGEALQKTYSATTARLHSWTWWLVLVAFVLIAALKLTLTGASL